MKDLLELLIKNIVEKEEEVQIIEREDEEGLILDVKVAESDMGRIIGKQGKTANAIRTIIKTRASKENKKVFVHILDK